MHTYLFQDWITIRGSSAVTTITQTEDCWLDLAGFQDVVFWLDVKNFGGGGATAQIAYQSATTKDEAFFLRIVPVLSFAQGLTITTATKDTTATPLARWLRWQLSVAGSPSSAWEATFRIFVAANATGSSLSRAGGLPAGTLSP